MNKRSITKLRELNQQRKASSGEARQERIEKIKIDTYLSNFFIMRSGILLICNLHSASGYFRNDRAGDFGDDWRLIYHYFMGVKYNTIQYNTIQYNTIQYNTIQYNTIQYNTIYNTIQYNTIQYNTIQYNTIQYNYIYTWWSEKTHQY